jgi:hypothetical protein
VLYQLSYLGTVQDKKSEALLQDRPRKIKLPGHPLSERSFETGCGGEGHLYPSLTKALEYNIEGLALTAA